MESLQNGDDSEDSRHAPSGQDDQSLSEPDPHQECADDAPLPAQVEHAPVSSKRAICDAVVAAPTEPAADAFDKTLRETFRLNDRDHDLFKATLDREYIESVDDIVVLLSSGWQLPTIEGMHPLAARRIRATFAGIQEKVVEEAKALSPPVLASATMPAKLSEPGPSSTRIRRDKAMVMERDAAMKSAAAASAASTLPASTAQAHSARALPSCTSPPSLTKRVSREDLHEKGTVDHAKRRKTEESVGKPKTRVEEAPPAKAKTHEARTQRHGAKSHEAKAKTHAPSSSSTARTGKAAQSTIPASTNTDPRDAVTTKHQKMEAKEKVHSKGARKRCGGGTSPSGTVETAHAPKRGKMMPTETSRASKNVDSCSRTRGRGAARRPAKPPSKKTTGRSRKPAKLPSSSSEDKLFSEDDDDEDDEDDEDDDTDDSDSGDSGSDSSSGDTEDIFKDFDKQLSKLKNRGTKDRAKKK